MALRRLTAPLLALVEARDLTWSWTLRIISARYEQSILGWLWAVVQPVSQVAIFTFVFTHFVRVDTGGVPYVLFSYAAITPWTFLAASLTDMCSAIVDNMRLVTKIYFPREVLPIAAMLARLIDFGIAFLLTFVLIAYYRVPLHLGQLVWLPVVIAIQLALTLGIGLAASAANTFVRDVKPLLLLGLQLWFYASPIIYPVENVPTVLRSLYVLNPAVGILEGYRAIWLNRPMPMAWLECAGAMSLTCLVAGYWFFKKSEAVFSDIA